MAELLDELSEPWTSVERAIWPHGPASGTGSGAYARLKARIIATLKAERDPLRPQWEDCKVCGGDHWTKDHHPVPVPAWAHTVKNDPAGLYDDQWEPRHDCSLDAATLTLALHARYGDDFPNRPDDDWRSDAEWIVARIEE